MSRLSVLFIKDHSVFNVNTCLGSQDNLIKLILFTSDTSNFSLSFFPPPWRQNSLDFNVVPKEVLWTSYLPQVSPFNQQFVTPTSPVPTLGSNPNVSVPIHRPLYLNFVLWRSFGSKTYQRNMYPGKFQFSK